MLASDTGRFGLVSQEFECLRSGTYEQEARCLDGPCECRVLCKKTVAWMDGIGTYLGGCGNDGIDVAIIGQLDGLIGQPPMRGSSVDSRKYRGSRFRLYAWQSASRPFNNRGQRR